MAVYVQFPNPQEVERAEAAISGAYTSIDEGYRGYLDRVAKLKDPNNRETRHLTAAERFADQQKLRAGTLEAFHKASGGELDSHRNALEGFASALDLNRLADTARHLPIMMGGEATAHDLRIIAEDVEAKRYSERVGRMTTSETIIAEARRIARDAGGEPHQTPELARLAVLDRHVRGLTGADAAKVKSALISAWSAVEQGWVSRNTLVQSLDRASRKLNIAHDIVLAVKTGREPTSVQIARSIGKQLVTARGADPSGS